MKEYSLEGRLLGSIRYCGNDEDRYLEVETYLADDGTFYNMRYAEVGENRYRIEMKKGETPLVEGRKAMSGYLI